MYFDYILAAILGFLFITLIDRIWFRIDYKKAEKGLEILEHYHYGIGLFAISFIFIEFLPVLAFTILAMGTAFIYHESKQKNFFAHQSSHFKDSTIIGLVLAGITIIAYFYLPAILS